MLQCFSASVLCIFINLHNDPQCFAYFFYTTYSSQKCIKNPPSTLADHLKPSLFRNNLSSFSFAKQCATFFSISIFASVSLCCERDDGQTREIFMRLARLGVGEGGGRGRGRNRLTNCKLSKFIFHDGSCKCRPL